MPGIRACVFDAYGTLFDVHSAVARLRAQARRAGRSRSPQLWRTKQLEYTWLRSLMGRHADFWQVTGDALDYALARTRRRPGAAARAADAGLPRARRLSRGAGGAARLRAAGLRTAILSNGEPGMLQAGAESAGIAGLLDAILSVEDGRHLQARPRGLSARGRPARRRAGRDRLPVVQRLGRARRRLLRPAPGVDQPLRAPRASACPAAPSTSCATSPACRSCSASERGRRRPFAAPAAPC